MTPRFLPQTARPARGGAARAAVAWLLVLVLLGAQGIGLWHRLAHHPHAAAAETSTVVTSAFGHAEDDLPACQAFDHLALADLLSVAVTTLAVVGAVVADIETVVDGIEKARPGHYRARAPPAA